MFITLKKDLISKDLISLKPTLVSSTYNNEPLMSEPFSPLKYGSEEKGSSLYKCSILLGFFMSKKLERLRSELLSEDKITNLLGFLTK